MTVKCHGCGAEWGGFRTEHCKVCHQTFTGHVAGDKHRVGDHTISEGPSRRRCLTREEMEAKGMRENTNGVWTSGGTSPWAED